MNDYQYYVDWVYKHWGEICEWTVTLLVTLTMLVHVMQRLAAAFARLAARTSNKYDDAAAQALSRILARCDWLLMALVRWLPRVGVGSRKQWSDEERKQRTSLPPPTGAP